MKKYILISMLLCSMALSGCAKKEEVIETVPATETVAEAEEKIMSIEPGDLNIYKKIRKNENDFVFSPAMIKNSFYTFYENSQGKLKNDIEKAFEFENSDYEKYKEFLLENEHDRIVAIENIYINEDKFKLDEVPKGVKVLAMNSENKNEEFHNIMELTDGNVQKGLPADFFENDSKIDIANTLVFNKFLDYAVFDQEFGRNDNMTSVIFGSGSTIDVKEIVENKMKLNILRIPYLKENNEDNNEHQYSLYVICDTMDKEEQNVDKYLNKIDEEKFDALLNFDDYEGLKNCSGIEFTIPYIDLSSAIDFKDYVYAMGLEDSLIYGNDELIGLGKNSITYYFHETTFKTSIPKVSDKIIELTDEEKEIIRKQEEKETNKVEEIIYSVKADSPFVFVVKDDTANQILLMGRKEVN